MTNIRPENVKTRVDDDDDDLCARRRGGIVSLSNET